MILRRESVVPADKTANLKDEQVRKQTYEMIYEVKLKEAMADVFRELIKASAIENQLTGTVKLANEEKDPDYGVDQDVKLMSRRSRRQGRRCTSDRAGRERVPVHERSCRPQPHCPAEAAQQFEKLRSPLEAAVRPARDKPTARAAPAALARVD